MKNICVWVNFDAQPLYTLIHNFFFTYYFSQHLGCYQIINTIPLHTTKKIQKTKTFAKKIYGMSLFIRHNLTLMMSSCENKWF